MRRGRTQWLKNGPRPTGEGTALPAFSFPSPEKVSATDEKAQRWEAHESLKAKVSESKVRGQLEAQKRIEAKAEKAERLAVALAFTAWTNTVNMVETMSANDAWNDPRSDHGDELPDELEFFPDQDALKEREPQEVAA